MDKQIYILYPDDPNHKSTLYTKTFNLALKNIAKKYGLDFVAHSCWKYEELYNIPHSDKETLFLTQLDTRQTPEDYLHIKEVLPNSKVILWGSDTHYIESGPYAIQWPIDLFLDPMKEVVYFAKKLFPSYHYWWTISQDIIDEISLQKFSNIKEHDLICVCKLVPNLKIRNQFFNGLSAIDLSFLVNLNIFDMTTLYHKYNSSWFTLGITHSAMAGRVEAKRSMKGFRDWIGPFCGSVLIYDDFPDLLEEFKEKDILPFYEYNKPSQVKELVTTLKGDHKLYLDYLDKQKKWAYTHTLENQFESIFLKEGFLCIQQPSP